MVNSEARSAIGTSSDKRGTSMKLTGNLKEQVEKAETKEEKKSLIEDAGMELSAEEAKKILKDAGLELTDTELDQVAGGLPRKITRVS